MNTVAADARMLPDHLHAPLLHAGFWQRFAAYLIDSLVLLPGFFVLEAVLMVPLGLQAAHHEQPDPAFSLGGFAIVWLLAILGPWLYFALCESSKLQATPGKLALGLRVTDMQGRRIGFGKATGRFFGKIVSGFVLNIGYMMAGWTARKQALHDMMANCCVVRRDALAAFERGDLDDSAPVGTSMPGWAVALIVLGMVFIFVIPVIAILAAIAIPAYQNYLIRAQVTQGLVLAGGAKTAVVDYAVEHDGSLPADNAAAGLAGPASIANTYVARVEVQQGNIIVTFGEHANPRISDRHLMLQPDVSRGDVQWHCGSDDIDARYLPMACRGDAREPSDP